MIIKIKTLIKITKVKLLNIFYIFFDLIYVLILNLNLVNKNYSKNQQVTFVTAVDERFYNNLENLFTSIRKYHKFDQIYIFNLSKSQKYLEAFQNLPNVTVINFDFENYPDFMKEKFYSAYDNDFKIGNYAWKAQIVLHLSKELKGILFWLDSRCLITKKLSNLIEVISSRKFYSPISSNKVKDWTHISLIDKLNIPNSIMSRRNLSSGVIGFDLSNNKVQDLINSWSKWSSDKELISPIGSSRMNNRQDQTLLTIAYYKIFKKLIFPRTHNVFGIRIHVDNL